MPQCPFCGTQDIDDNHIYCYKCGNSMTGGTGCLSRDSILEGRYIIVKVLGRGGMGAIYLALDQRLNNIPVALKEMSTNAVGAGNLHGAIAAFKKEATMLISLRQPSLPRITDFFSQGEDRWYLVMDYIDGLNLKEVINKRGCIPEVEVLDWAYQLCSILDYLHSQNPPVIFRDLKPSNIMLNPEGQIKLIDFGIARHFQPGSSADTTVYGSHGFAPPEQYGNNQTDPRSDIYALGATLHYLLTEIDPGKNPFNFEPPSRTAKVSPQMERAIMTALELNVDRRPGNIQEMRDLLPKVAISAGSASARVKQPPQLTGSTAAECQQVNYSSETAEDLNPKSWDKFGENDMSDIPKTDCTETVLINASRNETSTMLIDSRQQPQVLQPINALDQDEAKRQYNVSSARTEPTRTSRITRKTLITACLAIILVCTGVYGYRNFSGEKQNNVTKDKAAVTETDNKELQAETAALLSTQGSSQNQTGRPNNIDQNITDSSAQSQNDNQEINKETHDSNNSLPTPPPKASSVITVHLDNMVFTYWVGSRMYTVNGIEHYGTEEGCPRITKGGIYASDTYWSERDGFPSLRPPSYDPETRIESFYFSRNNSTLEVIIGSKKCRLNGVERVMNLAPYRQASSTGGEFFMFPMVDIFQAFGGEVQVN